MSNTDYAQPSSAITILYALALFELMVGFLGIIFADFYYTFFVLTIISGCIGIFSIFYCMLNPSVITTYDVLGIALMFAYGTGTLNTVVYGIVNGETNVLTHSITSGYWLSRTLGMVVSCVAFLHLIGRADSRSRIFVAKTFSNTPPPGALLFIAGTVLLSGIFLATGRLGFMANMATSAGSMQISPSVAITTGLMTPAGALSVFLARRESRKNYAIAYYAFFIILLCMQFGLGRRIFVFSLVTNIAALVASKRPKNLISIKNIIAVIVIGITVQIATTAFYTLRLATLSFKSLSEKPSITQLLPEAIDIYVNKDKNFLDEKIKENVGNRSFVLEYLALISSKTTLDKALYGQNIARAAIVATPSFIYPEKFLNPLFGSEEFLVHPHLKLPVWDAANSILTASVADFGEIGFFFLPAVLCFMYSCILYGIHKITGKLPSLLISFFLMNMLLSAENDIVLYISSLRNIFIITIIAWIFQKMVSKKIMVR